MKTTIYRQAVIHYGAEAQLRQAQEECAELIVAISHYLRKREGSYNELIEETADVAIMLEQIAVIVSVERVVACREKKLDRIKNSLP